MSTSHASGLGIPEPTLAPLLAEFLEPAALSALPAEARGAGIERTTIDGLELRASDSTARLYRHRIGQFVAWCAARDLRAAPVHPEVLRLYLGWLAAHKHSWSTINVSVTAPGRRRLTPVS